MIELAEKLLTAYTVAALVLGALAITAIYFVVTKLILKRKDK